MADLMREIVEEVLGRAGARKPGSGQAAAQAAASGSPGAPVAPVALNRPNWQQAYRDKRLQMAGGSGAVAQATAGRKDPARPDAGTEPARTPPGIGGQREFVEQSLSPLLRLMMVQGKAADEPQSGAPFVDDGGQPVLHHAGMMGRLDGGVRCWYYPDLDPRLAAEFGLHRAQPVSVGVVVSESGSPRPLFVLDEVLKAGPVRTDVTVHREAGAFEVRLIGQERGAIQSALERLSRELRRQPGSDVRVLTAPEPSAALTRALDIAAREAAAVFDGLSRHRSIALLDRAFKAAPDLEIRFRIEPAYLLIHGARDAVLEAVKVMKREAGPYLTEE